MNDLRSKKAIVTGATQGLGFAMAEALCEEGVTVCILDISPKLPEVIESFKEKGYDVHGVQADLSQVEKITNYFGAALEKLDGDIDILVNNAGIHKPLPAEELSLSDFKRVLDVNVVAVFELARLAAAKMKQNQKGKIINIASVLAVQGGFNATAYSASKGAVAQLTKSLSNEWAKDGINVNAIAPGYYNTELNTHILTDEARYQDLISRVPAGRFGEPKEIGGMIKFLASDLSDFVSGALLPVDGGFLGR
ncbi:glucose 1-dehydrogenase [Pseudogracilibacillus sp. SE30717A]|uniref:SDR family NAD(P)-dependent oxidoreductase n=1 Tax=Pseudogracilibacillus sp. SE30717A TaxID=3098293 RepID=UPI00300E6475